LSEHPLGRDLPLVARSLMTCRYLMGEVPTSPVTFETLAQPLDDLAAQIGRLAPLEMVHPLELPLSCPVVFAACNDRYFYQHALTLAASLHATNVGKLALHLHLYSPNQGILDEGKRLRTRFPGVSIGVSLERGDCPLSHPPSYFAMARFVRAHQVFSLYQSALCIVDVDALFNKPWEHVLAQFDAGTEIALACPAAAPFWEEVTAPFVYCKSNPAVSLVPADQLIDIHQHPQAPIWAVSTRKFGVRAYDERREELGRRYGFCPLGNRSSVYSHVARVEAPVFFVQIGAMDGTSFDPIHAHGKAHNWRGILVEPLPDMMDRLRNNYRQQKGLAFENVAITEQEERRTLYRVPTEAIKQAGLPDWVMGMSTFVPGKLDCYKPHVVAQSVTCIPLVKLLAKHRPAKIDILQIDAEGYDFKILKQFDLARYRPSIVSFEFVNLSCQEKSEVETMLLGHGYLLYQEDQDVFAVRRDIIFAD
jgi:FkbM family methyltransferase